MFKEYFVVRRGTEWWVVDDGITTGPYLSRNIARESAIHLAKADFSNHINAKVYVEESLMTGMTLIYDSSVAGG